MALTVSIAICTKDHPEDLRRCLASLAPVRDQVCEVIVVDNNSKGDATREIAMAFGVKYVKETRPGAIAARNRAVVTAQGEIIAFTDDDCQIDPGWISAIRFGFIDPEVACVTGRAISPPGANWVQRQFDSYSRRFLSNTPWQIRPEGVGPIYFRAVAGVFANMALRRKLVLELKGFPEALISGEDNYIFYKIVQAGFKLQYVPTSIVYERHRERLLPHVSRFFVYGLGASQLVWYLSAEVRSVRLFLLNALVLCTTNVLAVLRSLVTGSFIHVLFGLSQLLGIAWGFLLLWRWRAYWGGDHSHCPESGVSMALGISAPPKGIHSLRRDEDTPGDSGKPEVGLPVLLYHHVGPPSTVYPEMSITPERFERQIRWLVRHGYVGVTAPDWLAWRREGKRLPARPIWLTFDDAYEDTAKYALPIIKRCGFSATVFVVTSQVGGTNTWDPAKGSKSPRLMTAQQIQHWAGQGIEFGAHTRTHPDLTALGERELSDEVGGSAQDLSRILGTRVVSFAYPYGFYNNAAKQCACASFDLAFTCEEGLNDLETDPHLLRRTTISPRETMTGFRSRARLGWNPAPRLRARFWLRTRAKALMKRLFERRE